MESGRETGTTSYLSDSSGQSSHRTQSRGQGTWPLPASSWEKHQSLCGCHTSLSTSVHLKPRVDICPRLLPLPLLCLVQVCPPNHPSLRAVEVLHASFCPLPGSTLRTQSRQIQSPVITATSFQGNIPQRSPYFGTHEGFWDQVFLF